MTASSTAVPRGCCSSTRRPRPAAARRRSGPARAALVVHPRRRPERRRDARRGRGPGAARGDRPAGRPGRAGRAGLARDRRVPLRRPAVPAGAGLLPAPGRRVAGRHGRASTTTSRQTITEHRWWSAAELDASAEQIYPAGLAELLRRHGADRAGTADRRTGVGSLMLAPPRTVVRREGGLYALERALQRRGFRHVAGADEAGRGACAGPLVAAAAILPEGRRGEIDELADSKLLTPAARERVYEQVVGAGAGLVGGDHPGRRGRRPRPARVQPRGDAPRARVADRPAPSTC